MLGICYSTFCCIVHPFGSVVSNKNDLFCENILFSRSQMNLIVLRVNTKNYVIFEARQFYWIKMRNSLFGLGN